eukprot:4610002-Amphidinium_carterae.1
MMLAASGQTSQQQRANDGTSTLPGGKTEQPLKIDALTAKASRSGDAAARLQEVQHSSLGRLLGLFALGTGRKPTHQMVLTLFVSMLGSASTSALRVRYRQFMASALSVHDWQCTASVLSAHDWGAGREAKV